MNGCVFPISFFCGRLILLQRFNLFGCELQPFFLEVSVRLFLFVVPLIRLGIGTAKRDAKIDPGRDKPLFGLRNVDAVVSRFGKMVTTSDGVRKNAPRVEILANPICRTKNGVARLRKNTWTVDAARGNRTRYSPNNFILN